jgi:uncharacterized RDD family membrane protein YckC
MTPASLLRRCGAIFYDALLLASVLFVATLPVLSITQGEAVAASHLLFRGYLLAIGIAYFVVPWMRGGQTLGMLAWRVKVCRLDGDKLSMDIALARWALAILSWLMFGLGFLVSVLDPRGRTLHDRWSGTILITVPKAGD